MNVLRSRSTLAFWLSLIVAVLATAYFSRYRNPDPGICVPSVHWTTAAGDRTIPLPLRMYPSRGPRHVLVFRAVFANAIDVARSAELYLGEGTPFVYARLNGVEVTPRVDPSRDLWRSLASQSIPLPRELLLSQGNLIELRMPLDSRLNGLRLDQVCLANSDKLGPTWTWNSAHQLTATRVCLSVLATMLFLVAFTYTLLGGNRALGWYGLVILLANIRVLYMSAFSVLPGDPHFWSMLGGISVVVLLWALYRLISALWLDRRTWLDRALARISGFGACAMLLQVVWPWHLLYPKVEVAFWLLVSGSACGMMWVMAGVIRNAHPVEWRPVMWGVIFAALCGSLEAVTYWRPISHNYIWTYPIGITVVVIAFGSVIARRAVLGVRILQRATHVLADDLDVALDLQSSRRDERIVDDLKTLSANDERQRMLKDIHDGFGSRLVMVLARLRREHPGSQLQQDMQRALVDLRLMIDAMDESARSLDVAFGALRHRLQSSLESQGIRTEWDIASLPAQQIDNRRKLMNLFRIVEELISNIVQHAHAERVVFTAHYRYGELVVVVRDDGRGMPADTAQGRGRGNIRRRVAMLDGTLEEGVGLDGRGYGATLRIPRM